MNGLDFLKQAKAKGIPKDVAAQKYQEFKSKGMFTDSPTAPKKEFKPSMFGDLASGYASGLTLGATDAASNLAAAGIGALRGKGSFKENYQQLRDQRPTGAKTLGSLLGYVSPHGVGKFLVKKVGGQAAKGLIGKGMQEIAKRGGAKTLKGLGYKTLGYGLKAGGEGALLGTAEQAISKQKIDPVNTLGAAAGTIAVGGAGKIAMQGGKLGKSALKSLLHKQYHMEGDKLSKKILESNVLRGAKTHEKLKTMAQNFEKHNLWGNSFEDILKNTNKKVVKYGNDLDKIVTEKGGNVSLQEMKNITSELSNSIKKDTKLIHEYGHQEVNSAVRKIIRNVLRTYKPTVKSKVSKNISIAKVLDMKRAADNNINYNVLPDQKIMLKSKVNYQFRKGLNKILNEKLGKGYTKANKNLEELLPIKDRVDYNLNKAYQRYEADEVSFGPTEFLRKVLSGTSPKQNIELANRIRGQTPYLLQMQKALKKGTPVIKKTVDPKVAKYGFYSTFVPTDER